MPIPNVPAEVVRDAMGRFDRELRYTSDWTDWEENRAHRYAIEHNGQRYPVKQIVSIAAGMPVSEFSGGQAAGNANQYVVSSGFAVVELRRRNPTWIRDELILALDMYLRCAGNPPRKGSIEIDELSETLNRLGRYLGIATEDRFRNVNGVYMKLMNEKDGLKPHSGFNQLPDQEPTKRLRRAALPPRCEPTPFFAR